ncbi:N-acetylmuramoyl-L-alanine amidase [uncultured archaeon]|nr:N-acetylmuramoyl-L-alanine amidase [uncultured archaeon]
MADSQPKKLILIDAGHGGPNDEGAVFTDQSGQVWRECDLTIQIARRVLNLLQADGRFMVMTTNEALDFPRDAACAARDRREMLGEYAMNAAAAGQPVSFLISIHVNSTEKRSSKPSGIVVCYNADAASAQQMKDSIIQNGAAAGEDLAGNRASNVVRRPELSMLNLPFPSLLVECGFIQNPHDFALLTSERGQALLAQSIAEGLSKLMWGTPLQQGRLLAADWPLDWSKFVPIPAPEPQIRPPLQKH